VLIERLGHFHGLCRTPLIIAAIDGKRAASDLSPCPFSAMRTIFLDVLLKFNGFELADVD
jgi:hypothetical protein